jgi:hypothetical protein
MVESLYGEKLSRQSQQFSGICGVAFRSPGDRRGKSTVRRKRIVDWSAYGPVAPCTTAAATGKSSGGRIWSGHTNHSFRDSSRLDRLLTHGISPIVTALVVILALPPDAFATTDGIVSPSSGNSIVTEPGRAVQIIVRLRLPLTPPPGVQQPEAINGWSVSLKRRTKYALSGAESDIEYPAKVIRIRPAGNDLYRIVARLLPWMSPGEYDLVIIGPGFSAQLLRGVQVGLAHRGELTGVEIDSQYGPRMIRVSNHTGESQTVVFDFVIPANYPGLKVEVDGVMAQPVTVTWSGLPRKGKEPDRLLAYSVTVPCQDENGRGFRKISWLKTDVRECVGRIDLNGDVAMIELLKWYELEYSCPSREFKAVIWSFGDGQWEEGLSVRHRWLLKEPAEIQVSAFDEFGSVSRARLDISRDLSQQHKGCSCSRVSIGRKSLILLFVEGVFLR